MPQEVSGIAMEATHRMGPDRLKQRLATHPQTMEEYEDPATILGPPPLQLIILPRRSDLIPFRRYVVKLA